MGRLRPAQTLRVPWVVSQEVFTRHSPSVNPASSGGSRRLGSPVLSRIGGFLSNRGSEQRPQRPGPQGTGEGAGDAAARLGRTRPARPPRCRLEGGNQAPLDGADQPATDQVREQLLRHLPGHAESVAKRHPRKAPWSVRMEQGGRRLACPLDQCRVQRRALRWRAQPIPSDLVSPQPHGLPLDVRQILQDVTQQRRIPAVTPRNFRKPLSQLREVGPGANTCQHFGHACLQPDSPVLQASGEVLSQEVHLDVAPVGMQGALLGQRDQRLTAGPQ